MTPTPEGLRERIAEALTSAHSSGRTVEDPLKAADAVLDALGDDLDRLVAWKQEALVVLREWERVWEALGKPGRLGESKAASSLAAVFVLRKGPE